MNKFSRKEQGADHVNCSSLDGPVCEPSKEERFRRRARSSVCSQVC